MPTLKTPLVGTYNNRSFASVGGKDQLVKAALITRIINKQANSATYYLEKRTGLAAFSYGGSTDSGIGVYASPSLSTTSNGNIFTVFNSSGTVSIYRGATNCGNMATGTTAPLLSHFTETIIGGVTYVLFALYYLNVFTPTQSAWYLPSDSTTGLTFTGTTHTSTLMDGITTTAGMYPGQAVSGSGIAANTRIASVNSAVAITLTLATSTSTTTTFTREAVAKFIDVDFPTTFIGGFAEMDGYISIMTTDRKVYNSDLNSVPSWTSSNFLTCSKYAGTGRGVKRYKSRIACLMSASVEFLYNAGNASGSPFSSGDEAIGSGTIAALSSNACDRVNDALYWIGNDSNIYKLDGYTARPISTLGTAVPYSPYVTAFYHNKKNYLNVQLDTTSNYWYCIDDDSYCDPSLIGGGYGAFASPSAGFVFFVFNVANSNVGGKLFYITDIAGGSSIFQDNSIAYTMAVQIQTDMGTGGRKFANQLRIVGDTQSAGSISVSWSDDDGTTFTTPRTIALTNQWKKLSGLGSWNAIRLWKFEDAGNNANRIKSIEIDYELEEA